MCAQALSLGQQWPFGLVSVNWVQNSPDHSGILGEQAGGSI